MCKWIVYWFEQGDIVNNNRLINAYVAGVAMIAAHNIMPMLIIPGTVGVCGSMIIYAISQKNNDRDMFETLGIKNANGAYPKLLGSRLIGKNTAKVYSIPSGMQYSDISKMKDKIENILHSRISLEKENYSFILTKIKSSYPKQIKRDFTTCKAGSIFSIGEDMAGNNVNLDLSGTEMHTGVFGSTGSGKSVFLNIIIIQIILNKYEVRVIDLKGGVEFAMYRDYPRLTKFAITVDEAESVLQSTIKLMNNRYDKLFKAKCKSFKDYNKKVGNMPPVFVIIDEYNALMDNKECKKMLFELLSRARAANIIIFICTQRPSADVLPGNIKCNLKNIVSFHVETDIDSEIVTSQKGNYIASRDLRTPGEGFIKLNGKFNLFKSYFLTSDEILLQIKDHLTGQRKLLENVRKPVDTIKSSKDIESIRSLI